MNARLALEEEVEILEEIQRRQKDKTVIGIVRPDGSLSHSITKNNNKWDTTLLPATMFIAEKLERVARSTKRFIIVIGGRASGKSIGIGDICLIKAKDEAIKTYCLREYQSSIKNSVHSLLSGEIKRLELEGFEILDNNIRREGNDMFQFAGLARNVDSVKSAFGFKNYWTEEAQTVSLDSLTALTPTARNKPNKGLPNTKLELVANSDTQMMFTANPSASEDPFSQRFIVPFLDTLDRDGYYEDDLHLIVVMNYTDNPWYKESGLEQERQFDYDNKPRAKYNWIWLGQFNDDVEDNIIQSEWFDAAIDAHKKIKGWSERGTKVFTHDPADTGEDAKAVAFRHGTIVKHADEKLDGDGNDACDWATETALDHDADMFVYDADGMGALLRRQINSSFEGKKIRVEAFKGSEGVDDPNEIYLGYDDSVDESKPKKNSDVFKNKRSQKYIGLARRFYNTYRAVEHGIFTDPDDMISISSDIKLIAKLRSELCRIPLKPDNGSGFIQVMSKLEMKNKHKIKSPNLADCIYMLWGVKPTVKRPPMKLKFKRAV